MTVQDHVATRPDDARLGRALAELVTGHPDGLRVVERSPNAFDSTSASEIVRCRLRGGGDRTLFCKFVALGGRTLEGRRVDPRREILVYRDLLPGAGVSAPRFFGAWRDEEEERLWLVLDYVEGALRLMEVPRADQVRAMTAAAAWLGSFHHHAEQLVADGGLDGFDGLETIPSGHYRDRLERMVAVRGERLRGRVWFERLLADFEVIEELLDDAPPTVLHGEFYPRNVLFRDGRVYPVDWETARIGPGELDLAMLTENWGPKISAACERAYCEARFGEPRPADFAARLAAARVHVSLYWLGHAFDPRRPKWSRRTAGSWRIDHLRIAWQQLRRAGRRAR